MPLDPAAATSSSMNSGFPSESRDPVEVGGAAASPSRMEAISVVGPRERSGRRGPPQATELRDEVVRWCCPRAGRRNEQHRDPAQVRGDVAQEVRLAGSIQCMSSTMKTSRRPRDVPEQIRDGIEEELLPVLRGCPGQVDGRQRRISRASCGPT